MSMMYLTSTELIEMLQQIEKEWGVCHITMNQDNLLENITVIDNTLGPLLSLSGDVYKCHINVAKGKRGPKGTEEYYNRKRLYFNEAEHQRNGGKPNFVL